MNWDEIKPYATAVVRHGLTLAAGALMTHGLLAKDQQTQFESVGVSLIVGVAGMAWSWWQKRHQARALAAANAGGLVKS